MWINSGHCGSECGVPFNAAAARQFEIAVEATAQFG